MLLLAHTITGAVIGQKVNNYYMIAILGFISHFLLDSLPQWNYDIPRDLSLREFLKIMPDILPSMLIYVVFVAIYPDQWLAITIGVTAAILPDFLTLTKYVKPLDKWFRVLQHFHNKLQGDLTGRHAQLIGLFSQTIYLGLLMIIFVLLP